jgi:UPF0716 family protein affecting phage T7 exclusion
LFESIGQLKIYTLPAGVTGTGLALVLSILTFFVGSWVTRDQAARDLDTDVRLVMES